MLWEQGVVGSNPATPTINKPLIIRYLLIVNGYFCLYIQMLKRLIYAVLCRIMPKFAENPCKTRAIHRNVEPCKISANGKN